MLKVLGLNYETGKHLVWKFLDVFELAVLRGLKVRHFAEFLRLIFFSGRGGHFEALVIIFVWFVLTLTWPTFLPLTTCVLDADRQLSGIRGVKTRHRGAVGHRGGAGRGEGQLVGVPGHAVQGLGQVCCPLQDDLLEINIFTDVNIHTAVSNNILYSSGQYPQE